jgi:hypothetical protein
MAGKEGGMRWEMRGFWGGVLGVKQEVFQT